MGRFLYDLYVIFVLTYFTCNLTNSLNKVNIISLCFTYELRPLYECKLGLFFSPKYNYFTL